MLSSFSLVMALISVAVVLEMLLWLASRAFEGRLLDISIGHLVHC